ncbi:PREDICTED: UPF0481 protein At3g47200-like [Nelumbo nucifera]|uniref:Uncharacterized protein n=2 Tax=Nelumbo nucifera TaxID=4432 RepID=A0A822Y4W2_NELNU|nr:PREDICTED: UPF0481 protein At3g47200-like [Nelumbo nucifera]DAD24648.1 TPA_asm: hypothetical protein HUJ06_026112 [Nelumbo nucifera]
MESRSNSSNHDNGSTSIEIVELDSGNEEAELKKKPENNDVYSLLQRGLRRKSKTVNGEREEQSQKVCIFRLPQGLADIDFKAHEPEIVSIGPFHRAKETLVEFQDHKWYFLDSLLQRSKDLSVYIEAMKIREMEAKKCYSERINMSSTEFVMMMLLDGGFIIELLHQVRGVTGMWDENNPLCAMPHLIPVIARDLLKLENQLPWFVLQDLFNLSKVTRDIDCDPLNLLALKFFNLFFPRPLDILKKSCKLDGRHLLELFHLSFGGLMMNHTVFRDPHSSDDSISYQDQSILQLQCVTQLQPSGIKFKPLKANSFLELNFRGPMHFKLVGQNWYQRPRFIDRLLFPSRLLLYVFLKMISYFRSGELQIPPITINEFTSTLLINCAAFEQHPGRYAHHCFTDYVAFMSCLINSSRDISILCVAGIISNFSESDRYVARLFNELGKNVGSKTRYSYLSGICTQVDTYYNSYPAMLRRTYFHSPWSYVSVFYAILLIGFTIVQTLYAVLSYLHRSN